MTVLQTIAVAFAMFSALPMPQFEWNEKNMRYAMCAFPLIGLVCGVLWCLCGVLPLPGLARAAAFCLVPVAVTGGIHLDGYADTSDALSSYGDREKKLEIMKDPSCGAFAVIYSGVYLLAYAGFACEVYLAGKILLLCPLFVLSRALSGLCAVNLPNARKAGMLCAFTSLARRRTATAALALTGFAAAAGMICLSPAAGGTAAVFAVLSALVYRRFAMAQFGGVTGDTSGFFLQLCELCGLVGAWVGGLL